MIRDDVTSYMMDRITTTSIWPIMFPGFNSFHFPQIASFDWNYIRFTPTHWGV
jgi:hypothetical protein